MNTTTLGLVLIALLAIIAFVLWHGTRATHLDQKEAKDERHALRARLKMRPTTCTPDVIETFADPSLPEISGDLSHTTK